MQHEGVVIRRVYASERYSLFDKAGYEVNVTG